MASYSELIGRLKEFLRNSDLDTTTTGILRRKLEEDFGVDLSDKKAFIGEQVDLFLQSQFEEQGENEEERDVDDEEDDDQEADIKSEETDGSVSKEDGDDGEEDEEATASDGKSNAKRGSSVNSISVYHC